jgi:hypothetical protein
MEAVIRTSDVGMLLVTTLELFTVGSGIIIKMRRILHDKRISA